MAELRRICFTGPESTGKTTLALRLADALEAPYVAESSRLYVEHVARDLTRDDVGPIATHHVALVDSVIAAKWPSGLPSDRDITWARDVLVLDTDLLSTVVYARHYYDAVPRWVARAERARRADLYFLCNIDIPWVADGVRDRPAHREELFTLFRNALARRGANVVRVEGTWGERWRIVRDAVERFGIRMPGERSP